MNVILRLRMENGQAYEKLCGPIEALYGKSLDALVVEDLNLQQ